MERAILGEADAGCSEEGQEEEVVEGGSIDSLQSSTEKEYPTGQQKEEAKEASRLNDSSGKPVLEARFPKICQCEY